MATITKQYNNRIHSTTKLTPNQASLKKNEGLVYHNLLNERKKIRSKFHVNDLVGTADLKRTFSKGDTTNWSYKLYKYTEIIEDTISSYHIDILPERYGKTLLKKTNLTSKENEAFMKKLNITQIRSKCFRPSELIETNLLVNSKAYLFISLGTTQSNSNSTLIGWVTVKFF